MISGNERVVSLLAQPVYLVNTWLLLVFPAWLVVAVWSVLSAAVSMLLYKRLSPQQKIAELTITIKNLQRQLLASDASPQELSGVMKRYISLSFSKVVVVLLPSLVSALPFLLVIPGLERSFSQMDIIHFGFDWMRQWITGVVFFALTTSLLLKYMFNIH